MIKFVKPLPVPEEMLGAYIEGRLSLEESHMIEDLINKSSDLSNLISDLCLPEASHSIYEDFPMFDTEFKLPETPIQIESSTFDVIDTHTVSPNDFPILFSDYDKLNKIITSKKRNKSKMLIPFKVLSKK